MTPDDGTGRALPWLDEDAPPPPAEPPPQLGRPFPTPAGPAATTPDPGVRPEVKQHAAPPPAGSLRRRPLIIAAAVLAVVVLAVVAVTAISYVLENRRSDSGGARTVSAPLDGRDRSNFELVTGTTTVTVRGGDLAGDLYRISTPAGASAVPEVVQGNDRLTLHLVPSGRKGPAEVSIELSSAVAWDLRLTGGAAVRVVDATALKVTRLAVAGGSTRTELSLAAPEGMVPINITEGLGELTVRRPGEIPARVRVGGGAGRVVLDDEVHGGVGAGTVLTTEDWTGAPNRYDIDLAAGAASVTVARPSA
jgi:hypothetical protein